ncbi:hypothetical protein EV361DRAFT_893156 [Lentinula raphanica]|nr:hypothetical protein EV361DRAFT_893156 [Lentinula raphanica]
MSCYFKLSSIIYVAALGFCCALFSLPSLDLVASYGTVSTFSIVLDSYHDLWILVLGLALVLRETRGSYGVCESTSFVLLSLIHRCTQVGLSMGRRDSSLQIYSVHLVILNLYHTHWNIY